MTERVVVEEHVVIEEHVVVDTVKVTEVDTVWQYKDYRTSFLESEGQLLVSKNYLFNTARQNTFEGSIRDALPFGDVFNWWRDKLGPCGIFQWNGEYYTTLLKEENIEEECYESTTSN
tara:strand:+ start:3265 stop:3618 length:354 start_codon:yes stop_codon:yes gene_type:complete